MTEIGGKFTLRYAVEFGPDIGSTIGSLDFESRNDCLRHDSPKLGPVNLSLSYGNKGNNDVYEAAAWLNGDLGGGHKLAVTLVSRVNSAAARRSRRFDFNPTARGQIRR